MPLDQNEKISDNKVMKSAAGFYVGREYFDEDCQCWLPYDRQSGYWKTRESAENKLKENY